MEAGSPLSDHRLAQIQLEKTNKKDWPDEVIMLLMATEKLGNNNLQESYPRSGPTIQ